jgi:Protein of unknown function (DUF732)
MAPAALRPSTFTVIKSSLLALAATVAVTPFAALAHADEDSYIEQLDKHNIPYSSESAAIKLGNAICSELKEGVSFTQIVKEMTDSTQGKLTQKQIGGYIGASAGGLCPAQWPGLKAQIDDVDSDS